MQVPLGQLLQVLLIMADGNLKSPNWGFLINLYNELYDTTSKFHAISFQNHLQHQKKMAELF